LSSPARYATAFKERAYYTPKQSKDTYKGKIGHDKSDNGGLVVSDGRHRVVVQADQAKRDDPDHSNDKKDQEGDDLEDNIMGELDETQREHKGEGHLIQPVGEISFLGFLLLALGPQ
jgi:hypothetical protein